MTNTKNNNYKLLKKCDHYLKMSSYMIQQLKNEWQLFENELYDITTQKNEWWWLLKNELYVIANKCEWQLPKNELYQCYIWNDYL